MKEANNSGYKDSSERVVRFEDFFARGGGDCWEHESRSIHCMHMTNEAISRSNGCRGLPSYSQKEVGRRVSFSSTVSVVSDNGDATESTTTSEWLSDAAVDDLSPRSLLSGRWTEHTTTESKNARGVSVVELMDHSPGLNCPVRKRLDFSESDRTRSPIKSCKGNHSIPNLAKSEASSSSLDENNMNENGRSNDSRDDFALEQNTNEPVDHSNARPETPNRRKAIYHQSTKLVCEISHSF